MDITHEKEFFEKNGWLIFDPKISEELIDRARASQQELFDKTQQETNDEDGSYFSARRIQDAWKYSSAIREIALFEYVHDFVKALYGQTPKAFQTLNFNVGTEQAPHSDTMHFNSDPAGLMCGVWVALEDIDMENGPLLYYSGSHLLSEWNMQHVDSEIPSAHAAASSFAKALCKQSWTNKFPKLQRKLLGISAAERYPRYEKFVAGKIIEHGLLPSYGTIKKGQALIWAANLLHGGSVRKDRSRTRNSQVTHYFFDGCRYYTPLLCSESYIHWRTPEWVV